MIRSWMLVFVFLCFVLSGFSLTLKDENRYEFKDGDSIALSFRNFGNTSSPDISHKVIHKYILIAPYSTVVFQLLDIPTYVLFVLTQVHSFKYNITLSYDDDLKPSRHVNGTNIGLVKQNPGMPPHNVQYFIMNHNPIAVMCLLAFEVYRDCDPVPGGCNTEFPVEIAPYLLLSYTEAVVKMDMQPAAYPGMDPECSSYPSPVELEVYHLYMDESNFSSEAYFEALKKMMSVEGMMRIGTLVPPPFEGTPLRRIHAAYPGTGSVYGVVARSPNGCVSAYVPAVTYACGNKINLYDDCEIFKIPLSETLCACMLFIGLFICSCGHIKFTIGSSLVSFLWGTVISCIILGMHFGTGYGIDLLGIFIGMIFAVVLCLLWLFFGIPCIAATASMLALGFLLASSIMYAGLGNTPWVSNDFSFWCVFLSITVVVPIIFMSAMHVGNIVACATLGAYVFIAPIDHYVGSNLKYIFLNTMRRAVDSDFRLAEVDPPFELVDLLLLIAWLTLAVAGTILQLMLLRGRPPFPPRRSTAAAASVLCGGAASPVPAPSTTQPRRSLLQRAALLGSGGGVGGGGGSGGGGGERTPLLVDVRIADSPNDSVFESSSPSSAPPALSRSAAAAPPAKDELAASTEKLATRLLAVLEPPPSPPEK